MVYKEFVERVNLITLSTVSVWPAVKRNKGRHKYM